MGNCENFLGSCNKHCSYFAHIYQTAAGPKIKETRNDEKWAKGKGKKKSQEKKLKVERE